MGRNKPTLNSWKMVLLFSTNSLTFALFCLFRTNCNPPEGAGLQPEGDS